MTNKVYKGCYLPCLWGITPGETTWTEAEKIMDQAGVPAYEYQSSSLSLQGLRMFEVAVQKFLDEDILGHDNELG
jgi:hypothetical protein